MAFDHKETSLYKFCQEIAKYKVTDMELCMDNCNYDTAKEYIEAKHGDVQSFIQLVTDTIYDECESWIKDGVIDDMVYQMLEDEFE